PIVRPPRSWVVLIRDSCRVPRQAGVPSGLGEGDPKGEFFLLDRQGMKLPRPIRHGLLTVAVLGIFTAALSAAALYRVIAFSMAQRLERAREAVGEELALIQSAGPGESVGPGESAGAPPAMIGMRGGIGEA